MPRAEHLRSDQSSMKTLLIGFLSQALAVAAVARTARYQRCAITICVLIYGCLQPSPAPSQSVEEPLETNSTPADEPITPIPKPPTTDSLKVELGGRLFGDPRLSHDNSRSCSSGHDLGTVGSTLPLNTLTVFNAALNFRFGWEGKFHTLESDTKALLDSPQIMGASIPEVVEKLDADPD